MQMNLIFYLCLTRASRGDLTSDPSKVQPMGVLVSEGLATPRTPVRNKLTPRSICLLAPEHLARPREDTEWVDTSLANGWTCFCLFVALARCLGFDMQMGLVFYLCLPRALLGDRCPRHKNVQWLNLYLLAQNLCLGFGHLADPTVTSQMGLVFYLCLPRALLGDRCPRHKNAKWLNLCPLARNLCLGFGHLADPTVTSQTPRRKQMAILVSEGPPRGPL